MTGFREKVNALFFQLEWLRTQELKFWQAEKIDKIPMNHWNQRHTANRLKKLENGKILQCSPGDEETPERILPDPEPGDPAEIERGRENGRPDDPG
jgi:hypothetical protein